MEINLNLFKLLNGVTIHRRSPGHAFRHPSAAEIFGDFGGRFSNLHTRLVQPSVSIWFFLHKKKVVKFCEKAFVWEFLLGGDTSKKRIKNFTRKTHHGGSPAPPRYPI